MITTTTDGKRTESELADVPDSLTAITEVASSPMTVESVNFCNKTSGSIDVTLIKRKASSGGDVAYLWETEVAANIRYLFEGHHLILQPGDVLMAEASAASSIDVSAVMLQAAK